MTEEKKKSLHPISHVLCEVYSALLARGEVRFPLHDEQIAKIDSVVKTVNASYFGFTPYDSPRMRAAAYFYYLIKNHPVTDGNKRLAVLWLELFASTFSLSYSLPEGVGFDELAVSVEKTATSASETILLIETALFGHGIEPSHT